MGAIKMVAAVNVSGAGSSLIQDALNSYEEKAYKSEIKKIEAEAKQESRNIQYGIKFKPTEGAAPQQVPKATPQFKSQAFPRDLPTVKLAQVTIDAPATSAPAAAALTDSQRAEFFKKFDFVTYERKIPETGSNRIITINNETAQFASMIDRRTGTARSISIIPEGLTVSGKPIPKGSILVSLHSNGSLDDAKSAIYTRDGKLVGNVNGLQLRANANGKADFSYGQSEIKSMYSYKDDIKFEPKMESFDRTISILNESISSGKIQVSNGSLRKTQNAF
jgi:hypothetical protein